METFGSTYAKAIDDLSGKIFIPALICSLFVELGPILETKFSFGFWTVYISVFIIGLIGSSLILYSILLLTIYIFDGKEIGPYVGLFIMPLGFAGLFPEHFTGIETPYSQVTGVAMLAWSFMLVRNTKFFRELLHDW